MAELTDGPVSNHGDRSVSVPAHTFAVIPAGGSGTRLGADRPKAFVEVAGRPLLAWSVEALAGASSIAEIVIAAPAGHEAEAETVAVDAAGRAAARIGGRPKVIGVVTGGPSRSHSVARALEVVPEAVGIVAVHDAARPMLESGLVDELVGTLARDQGTAAVIAAAKVADTIKQTAAGADVVEATLDRSRLWAVQTPQVFRHDMLRRSLDVGDSELAAASDDAALVEAAGGQVRLLESPPTNFKVTTAADLALASALLTNRPGRDG